jgi:hypothetical protein
MADWSETMRARESELAGWEARCRAEYERLGRARGLMRFFRPLAPAERESMERAALAAAGDVEPRAAHAFLDELAGLYLAEKSPQVRAAMRAAIGNSDALFRTLWDYAEQTPDLVRGPSDETRLRRGLAAIALDDMRVDVRRLDELLGRIYVTATRSGIEPGPIFQAVAAVSNPGAAGGGAHMRSFLADFEGSLHFKQHVAPRLRPASAVRAG